MQADRVSSRRERYAGMYLPSVAPKTTNERRRRRECCSSARHRDTDRAAPRSTAGLPRRRLATGSEVTRNWYPSDPCPISASSSSSFFPAPFFPPPSPTPSRSEPKNSRRRSSFPRATSRGGSEAISAEEEREPRV